MLVLRFLIGFPYFISTLFWIMPLTITFIICSVVNYSIYWVLLAVLALFLEASTIPLAHEYAEFKNLLQFARILGVFRDDIMEITGDIKSYLDNISSSSTFGNKS